MSQYHRVREEMGHDKCLRVREEMGHDKCLSVREEMGHDKCLSISGSGRRWDMTSVSVSQGQGGDGT